LDRAAPSLLILRQPRGRPAASQPWPDALEAFTGSREMSGEAMIAYFKPLLAWLREQKRGRQCGW
jgi:peptidyl-dipeptidase A